MTTFQATGLITWVQSLLVMACLLLKVLSVVEFLSWKKIFAKEKLLLKKHSRKKIFSKENLSNKKKYSWIFFSHFLWKNLLARKSHYLSCWKQNLLERKSFLKRKSSWKKIMKKSSQKRIISSRKEIFSKGNHLERKSRRKKIWLNNRII